MGGNCRTYVPRVAWGRRRCAKMCWLTKATLFPLCSCFRFPQVVLLSGFSGFLFFFIFYVRCSCFRFWFSLLFASCLSSSSPSSLCSPHWFSLCFSLFYLLCFHLVGCSVFLSVIALFFTFASVFFLFVSVYSGWGWCNWRRSWCSCVGWPMLLSLFLCVHFVSIPCSCFCSSSGFLSSSLCLLPPFLVAFVWLL